MLTFEQVLKLAKEHVGVDVRQLRGIPDGPRAIEYPASLEGRRVANFVSALLMEVPTVADLAAQAEAETRGHQDS